MSEINYQETIKYVQLSLSFARKLHDDFPLDWAAIESDVIHLIWERSGQFDPNKPIKPWIITIIRNRIKNAKRDRVCKTFYHVRNFNQLSTQFTEDGEVIYVPDAPAQEIPESRISDFLVFLDESERKVLTLLLDGSERPDIQKALKLSYQQVCLRITKIRKAYRRFLNTHELPAQR